MAGSLGQESGVEQMTCEYRSVVAHELLQIPEIESVLVSAQDECVSAWSVVNNATEEVRDRIYDQELLIMKSLNIGVEFQILDRHERPLEDLVSEASLTIFRK